MTLALRLGRRMRRLVLPGAFVLLAFALRADPQAGRLESLDLGQLIGILKRHEPIIPGIELNGSAEARAQVDLVDLLQDRLSRQIKQSTQCDDLALLTLSRTSTHQDAAFLGYELRSNALMRLDELRCPEAGPAAFRIIRGDVAWIGHLSSAAWGVLSHYPDVGPYTAELPSTVAKLIAVISELHIGSDSAGPSDPYFNTYLHDALPAIKRHWTPSMRRVVGAGLRLPLHPETRAILERLLELGPRPTRSAIGQTERGQGHVVDRGR